MNKIKYILNLHQASNFTLTPSFVPAYCNCLSVQEAIESLPLALNCAFVRRHLLAKIKRDIEHRYSDYHKKVISKLKIGFHTLDYKNRHNVSACLKSLCEVLPESECIPIISLLISSKNVTIRRKGYAIIKTESAAKHTDLITCWEHYKDLECTWCLVKYAEEDILIEKRKELLPLLEEYGIRRLYLRISKLDLSLLQELKEISPASYAYTLVKLGLLFSKKEALEIFDVSMVDENLGLFLWCLGQKRMWDTLEKIEHKLPEIEKARTKYLTEKYATHIDQNMEIKLSSVLDKIKS